MKITVLEETKTVSLKAETEVEVFIVGVIAGRFPRSIAYRPKSRDTGVAGDEDGGAEVRISYSDLMDRLAG